jgi:hypothetical protein
MEYVSEMSEPRYKKLTFYCHNCKAFRVTYEPSKDKLFTILLDGIDFSNILAPHIQKRLNSESASLVSPLDTSVNKGKQPS